MPSEKDRSLRLDLVLGGKIAGVLFLERVYCGPGVASPIPPVILRKESCAKVVFMGSVTNTLKYRSLNVPGIKSDTCSFSNLNEVVSSHLEKK